MSVWVGVEGARARVGGRRARLLWPAVVGRTSQAAAWAAYRQRRRGLNPYAVSRDRADVTGHGSGEA
eukprot:5260808-Prymnesium_polylepis.1